METQKPVGVLVLIAIPAPFGSLFDHIKQIERRPSNRNTAEAILAKGFETWLRENPDKAPSDGVI